MSHFLVAMASAFKRGGKWFVKIRVWDGTAGAWKWVQKTTGCLDRPSALKIGEALEDASAAAKAGTMTRQKALALVDYIVRLANAEGVAPIPTLAEFVPPFLATKVAQVEPGSARKYVAHWRRAEAPGGLPCSRRMDAVTMTEIREYHGRLCAELSSVTANDHLVSVRMWFEHARALGHIPHNPASGVKLARRNAVGKEPITREEMERVTAAMRAEGRQDWEALTLLGWCTGHRIGDLLAVAPEDFEVVDGVGWVLTLRPQKKRNAGGRVVRLPIPADVAEMCREGFGSIIRASGNNRNGNVSAEFVGWLRKAGIDPQPVVNGKRTVHKKSFHSLRHAMASRLAAAGVPGDLARMVTDHDSAAVARRYQHAEITALAAALEKVR